MTLMMLVGHNQNQEYGGTFAQHTLTSPVGSNLCNSLLSSLWTCFPNNMHVTKPAVMSKNTLGFRVLASATPPAALGTGGNVAKGEDAAEGKVDAAAVVGDNDADVNNVELLPLEEAKMLLSDGVVEPAVNEVEAAAKGEVNALKGLLAAEVGAAGEVNGLTVEDAPVKAELVLKVVEAAVGTEEVVKKLGTEWKREQEVPLSDEVVLNNG